MDKDFYDAIVQRIDRNLNEIEGLLFVYRENRRNLKEALELLRSLKEILAMEEK